jgi:hypothetical protein
MAHYFGPSHNIMQVLHHQKKGAHLNTKERFHIHIEHAARNRLNDDRTIFPNRIFDTLIKFIAPPPPHPENCPDPNTPLIARPSAKPAILQCSHVRIPDTVITQWRRGIIKCDTVPSDTKWHSLYNRRVILSHSAVPPFITSERDTEATFK